MTNPTPKKKPLDTALLTIVASIWSCILIVVALFVIIYFDMVPTGVGLGPITFTQPTPTQENVETPPSIEAPPTTNPTVINSPAAEILPTPTVFTPPPNPTVAVIPTITPSYTVLLHDDFELGISNQWQSEGNWLMTNGHLTPSEIKDSKIYSVDTSWVNYEGEITFEVTENLFLFVMLRTQNPDNYVEFILQCGWNGNYFSLYTGDYMFWRIRKNGNVTDIPGTQTETSCRNERATIYFSSVDNVYRATYKGKTISFADPDNTFVSGGIGLRFYPFEKATDALVKFDEIRVRTK
ncbi:MAG: hypothetical protein KJZ77_11665 [Anaerolineales bacterium]|nr:hypothetical protein [Anaerolineales bacterium]